MLYKVYTKKSDGWCMDYVENVKYISAESEDKAKEIYKKNVKVGKKKVYVNKSNKKGVVTFV